MTQPSIADGRQRGRGIRRMLILLAWAATLLALLYGEEDWRGRRAWNQSRQELESHGEELDFKAFIPKPIPDEQNFAATPFVQSWISDREGLEARWKDSYAWGAGKISSSGEKGKRQFIDLAAWQMAFDAFHSDGKTQKFKSDKLDLESRAKAASAVLQELKASGTNLALIRTASTRPHARYPVNYDLDNPWGILLPHLANLNHACQRLQLEACAELAAGQSQSAWEDFKLMFYLADTVKDEPFLISYLVRLACVQTALQPVWEGLAEHRWSEPQLRELQALLQQYHLAADMHRPLSGEQATGILTVELIKKKGLGMLVALEGPGAPTPSDMRLADLCGIVVPSGWYYLELVNYCRLYQAELGGAFNEAKKLISPSQIKSNSRELEREIAGGRLGRGLNATIHHHVIASLLLPALNKIPLKAATAQASIDQATLACALERYRLGNKQFPEKLEALVPQFIGHLPNDVLTGEPYKYRCTAEGRFVLYSLGWNEKDDGGVPGRTRFDEQEGDWVWESEPSGH